MEVSTVNLIEIDRMFPDVIARARELVPEDISSPETVVTNTATGESFTTTFPGYSHEQWRRFLAEVERLVAEAAALADA